MTIHRHSLSQPAAVAAVSVVWRGRVRTLKTGRLGALVLVIALPLLAAWYLGATAYFIFHDQLLASLISRQTEMQYAYEDRIAGLKSDLDRETSRGLIDRQALSNSVRDLLSRSERLEARSVAVDGLMRSFDGIGTRGSDKTASQAPAARLPDDVSAYAGLPPSPALRLDGPVNIGRERSTTPDVQDHVELVPDRIPAHVADALTRVEDRQTAQVARLRGPMVQAIARLKAALADTGLSATRWDPSAGENARGGPFVPLDENGGAIDFDRNVALLKDAAARHARLRDVVAHVPLRRPLDGQLEVTSPFGARLDPFFGRAAMHTGIDFMRGYGGPVSATADGVVTLAGPEGGYGNMVEIDHGNGLVTRYAHLSAIEVVPHQKISAGGVVGLVGSTGRATGPHLHYETRVNGEPVDPSRFLRAGASLFPG